MQRQWHVTLEKKMGVTRHSVIGYLAIITVTAQRSFGILCFLYFFFTYLLFNYRLVCFILAINAKTTQRNKKKYSERCLVARHASRSSCAWLVEIGSICVNLLLTPGTYTDPVCARSYAFKKGLVILLALYKYISTFYTVHAYCLHRHRLLIISKYFGNFRYLPVQDTRQDTRIFIFRRFQ